MAAPTGLHGWIQSNDGRSTGLFLGFLFAIQLIAPLALLLPLVFLDVHHAPFFGWGGYLVRYAPLVLVGSVAWFAAQLWWHVETVKRAVGFHFVDDADEPRLCRVIEPLIILTGLPVPFVGVIESDARNAFACGIGRKKAVVVATRGLLDALDDVELASVLAHELSHIRNGDIRLMAAANIFMSTLTRLHARNVLRFTPVHGVIALIVPAVLPLSIAGSVIGRVALRAGQVSRLLIASSREFIADAEAAQWTRNPGALASALLKVDGRHRVACARAEDDAMMIAGESVGPGATHPTVAQRVAALARVTGSMVFNAPHAPREEDWTPAVSRDAVERIAFGRRAMATGAIARVRQGDGENLLGLTPWGTLALVVTVGALIGLHWDDLGNARAMAATFDPRPIGRMVGARTACEFGPFSVLARARCRGALNDGTLDEAAEERRRRNGGCGPLVCPAADPDRVERETYRGQSGRMPPATVTRDTDGLYVHADGRTTYAPPVELIVAETDRFSCFVRDPRPIEKTGPIPLDRPGSGDEIARIRSDLDHLAAETVSGSVEPSAITYYVERRETLVDRAYALYGRPGLEAIRPVLLGPDQAAAIERLRRASYDAAVARDLSPIQQAKWRALLRDPAAFVPCRSLASPG